MMNIVVAGDICPIGMNAPLLQAGDATRLLNDLEPVFGSADLVIANLECPLITRPTPIRKTGPTFGAAQSVLNGVKASGVDLLCLANNHILDHGAEGLASTLEACKAMGIETVGAGPDIATARRPWSRTIKGVRIGVIAMAEHEFSIVKPYRGGASPLDVIDFVRNVTEIGGDIDYLVVLLHAGREFLEAPSPRLRDTCRFLIETGAHAVIVQHPHSFGGYEHYRGGHIVYGQGALWMDEAIYRDVSSFHEGILVRLTPGSDRPAAMDLIPFVQSAGEPGARRMPGPAEVATLATLAEKARRVNDDDYIRDQWLRVCNEEKHAYLGVLRGHNRLLRRLNRNGRLSKLLYDSQRLLGTRNVVCCETHREALETIFDEDLV